MIQIFIKLFKDSFTGRTNDVVESTAPDTNDDEVFPVMETSTLEELANPDVFQERRIGQKPNKPWVGKKCNSCSKGFVARSKTRKCHDCDSYTHDRNSCVQFCHESNQFYCKKCKNRESRPSSADNVTVVNDKFKCEVCGLLSKSKWSIQRHIRTKYDDI